MVGRIFTDLVIELSLIVDNCGWWVGGGVTARGGVCAQQRLPAAATALSGGSPLLSKPLFRFSALRGSDKDIFVEQEQHMVCIKYAPFARPRQFLSQLCERLEIARMSDEP